MYRSIKTRTAIGSQETEPRPSNIIQIDQNLPGTGLDRLITEKMVQILNAMPDASGRRDYWGLQIRSHWGADVLLQLFLSAWGYCFVGLVVDSITTNHTARPSLRRRSMMLMPNSVLMRLSRYQTMWSSSMPMNSAIASSADRFDSATTVASDWLRQRPNVSGAAPSSFSTTTIAFVSDEIRRSILRQQPDSLRLELWRVFRAFCHGSIISHRVSGNAEQKSVHISTLRAPSVFPNCLYANWSNALLRFRQNCAGIQGFDINLGVGPFMVDALSAQSNS